MGIFFRAYKEGSLDTLLDEDKKLLAMRKLIYAKYNNLTEFQTNMEKFLNSLRMSGIQDRETLLQLFREVMIKVEKVEYYCLGTSIYSKDQIGHLISLAQDTTYIDIIPLAEDYVSCLIENYNSLDACIKTEAKSFYTFKCNLIDTFVGLEEVVAC